MRDRREIRGVGLDQNAIVWDRADHVVAIPVLESDNSAEGHIPASVQRRARELGTTGEAVKHSEYSFDPGLANHRSGVVVGVACMHNHGAHESFGELELQGEGAALEVSRRVIVVVIESAFADRHRAGIEESLEFSDVRARVERCRVVRMDSGCECDEARMRCRNPG